MPLLANVLLDDVDQVLEKRGHAFVRYADDCNVYVRSPKAGARVLTCLRVQYARLRLRINEEKSTVARVITRQFLGSLVFPFSQGEPVPTVEDPVREIFVDDEAGREGRGFEAAVYDDRRIGMGGSSRGFGSPGETGVRRDMRCQLWRTDVR